MFVRELPIKKNTYTLFLYEASETKDSENCPNLYKNRENYGFS